MLFFYLLFAGLNLVSALWPLPQRLSTGTTPLKLSPSFDIEIDIEAPSIPEDLLDAVSRLAYQLAYDELEILTPDRGASNAAALADATELHQLTVSLAPGFTARSISEEAVDTLTSRQEGYTLSVPADGSAALLVANSTLGLYRGLTTFGQLWYNLDGEVYTMQAPIEIEDAPAYPYRGLMLDTARHYFPVCDILRTLDAMSWVKMNTFHWHVVDSQSFPLVVPGFTELSEKAAYSASSVYTEDDVEDIVSYAAARGIDVVVEIDTPGHTASISLSHPEHIACAFSSPWQSFAAEPPAGQLRLANNETTAFTAELLKAVAGMFPSKFLSTGGDELNTHCYDLDASTQADLTTSSKTLAQALDTFTQASHHALNDVGKTPIVWEEMVLDHEIALSNETIVMVWISSENVKSVAEKGFQVVHAASDYFYLDCGHGAWLGDDVDGTSWCDPFKTWQKSYSFDPVSGLTAEESKLILGGQQLLWTEQSHSSNLDSTVWPRAASSAEVFWTGAARGNVSTALPRLHDLAFRMTQRGVGAVALQPLWCALRPGACDISA